MRIRPAGNRTFTILTFLFVVRTTRRPGWTPLMIKLFLQESDRVPGFTTYGVHRIYYAVTPQRYPTTKTPPNKT